MAHFRVVAQGSRGSISRLGGKGGIQSWNNGWQVGVYAHGYFDEKTGKDTFKIYKTGGSSGQFQDELVATVEGE